MADIPIARKKVTRGLPKERKYADDRVPTIEELQKLDLEIEDLGKRLETRFHLYLNKRDDWTKFKEFFYRRHIVIHNYGFPDAKYIEKTQNTEFEVKGEKNRWLEISDKYIYEAFETFLNYANEIADFFRQKYPDETT